MGFPKVHKASFLLPQVTMKQLIILEKIIILYPEFSAEFEILKQQYDFLGGKKLIIIKNGLKKTGTKINHKALNS